MVHSSKIVKRNIPPVDIDYLKKRYKVVYPKTLASHSEVPDPELYSRLKSRTVKKVILFGSEYRVEDIIYCIENPHVLPEETDPNLFLIYQEIYEAYYMQDGKLIDRISHLEVLESQLTPVPKKESISKKEVIKILMQKGRADERLEYIAHLEKRVEELENFNTNLMLKLQQLGIEI